MQEHQDGAVARRAAARLDRLLDCVTREVGAHIGLTYLHVPERQVLQMTAVTGAPDRLAWPWVRLALEAPTPPQEAFRSRTPVWLSDQQELARRFPRSALAFPYSVAHYNAPLLAGGVCWGVLNLLWPGSRPGLSGAEQALLDEVADRMAEVLRDAAARHQPVVPRDEPLIIEPPLSRDIEPAAALVERFTEGCVAVDLQGRMTFLTERAALLLGRDRAELLGAEPWEALPWLEDPAYENAFVSALFSRRPTGFSARRPDGTWLTFTLFPDATGVSVRIKPRELADGEHEPADNAPSAVPARAGALFHLLHLATALTEAAGVDELAETLIAQIRPVIGAEGLALIVAQEGRLRVVDSRGFPPEMPEHFNGLLMASHSEAIRTMETGVPGFHPTSDDLTRAFPQHPHYGAMGSFAFLPLAVSGGASGCLVLGYDKPRPFTPGERAELTALAGMIALALERALLYDTNARAARGLQEGLLPRRLPRVPGLTVAARYRPATHALEVGGDFYDLIDFGALAAGAVIGDVQGHNVQAAALMGQIRTTVHSHARTGAPPEEILARTNRLLLELNSPMFCSCLYAHIDVPGQRVKLASAGHLPPILRHPSYRTEVLDLPPGLLLGVEEDVLFETVEVPLPPGSLLALYTDGLVERPGIGLEQAVDCLAEQLALAGDQPLDALADGLLKRAQEAAAPRSGDDTALLLVECDRAGRIHVACPAGPAGRTPRGDGRSARPDGGG